MNYDFTRTHKVLSLLNNANVIWLMILELLAFSVSHNVPLFVFYMNFVPVFDIYIYMYIVILWKAAR